MQQPKAHSRRCAIYTRKSSEEGLAQDFNSLHAQREACEAFIKSQTAEGWKLSVRARRDQWRAALPVLGLQIPGQAAPPVTTM